ncbi:MAG: hypothetical protein ACOYS2_02325 [Patescibacteria group bacterium]
MSIYEKIEEIRRKPEHIRLRYVWIMVGISFFIIILIWGLSFYARKTREKQLQEWYGTEFFDDLKDEKKTLDEYKDKMGDIKKQLEDAKSQASQTEGGNPAQ